MSGSFKKEDLRIIKTHKALMSSLQVMLSKSSFKQITVNDICEEALVSRATFYAHFYDKYDLLEKWLYGVSKELARNMDEYSVAEQDINQFLNSNNKMVINLVEGADEETRSLLHKFLFSFIEPSLSKKPYDENSLNYSVLSNFCSGGIYNLLVWQVKNNFPPQAQMINSYFYHLMVCIIDWDAHQEQC